MPSTTTIPAAIDGLIALIAAAVPDVDVADGPPFAGAPMFDYIIVGGDPDDDAVTGTQTPATIGGFVRDERYTILVEVCASEGGDPPQKTVRDRAAQMFAAIEDALFADAKLGGAVKFAQVAGPVRLDQAPLTEVRDQEEVIVGRRAAFRFAVACQAQLRRPPA